MHDGLNLIDSQRASARELLGCACVRVWMMVRICVVHLIRFHLSSSAFLVSSHIYQSRSQISLAFISSSHFILFYREECVSFIWTHAARVPTGLWCGCQTMTTLFGGETVRGESEGLWDFVHNQTVFIQKWVMKQEETQYLFHTYSCSVNNIMWPNNTDVTTALISMEQTIMLSAGLVLQQHFTVRCCCCTTLQYFCISKVIQT